MNRSGKKSATLVEETIETIRKKGVNSKVIAKVCRKNKISEDHIRKVALWKCK